MYHESYVRFVDTHTESICCDHYLLAVVDKVVLIALPLLIGKPCMVSCGGESIAAESFAYVLYIPARETVDNS